MWCLATTFALLPLVATLTAAQTSSVNCRLTYPTSGPNDTCDRLLNDYGLTMEQFYALNPAVGADCELYTIGPEYCIRGWVETVDGNSTSTWLPSGPTITVTGAPRTLTLTIVHASNGTAISHSMTSSSSPSSSSPSLSSTFSPTSSHVKSTTAPASDTTSSTSESPAESTTEPSATADSDTSAAAEANIHVAVAFSVSVALGISLSFL